MIALRLLRPEQWTKNLFLFAALVFGRKLFDGPSALLGVLGFFCFSFVSSAVYIINDIHDRAEDRLHPTKRTRPIRETATSRRTTVCVEAHPTVLVPTMA